MFRSLFLAARLMAFTRLRQTQVKSFCHQSITDSDRDVTVIGTVVTGDRLLAIMNGVKPLVASPIMATIVAGINKAYERLS